MEFKVLKEKKSKIELELKIQKEDFEKSLEKVLTKLSQEIQIEGFRKGKAPLKLVLERVGKEKVYPEALEEAIKEGYLSAIEKLKLQPISLPSAEILEIDLFNSEFSLNPEGKALIKLSFEIYPRFELPNYREIAKSVKKRKIEVKEEEVDKVLEDLRKMRPQYIPLQKPAQEGDFVEVEFSSSDFPEQKKVQDAFVLGKAKLLPGVESALIGMRAGETKTIKVKVPQDHFLAKEQGKEEINLKIFLKDIKKVVFPELTDDFAKSLGNFENLEALKRSVKEGLTLEKETKESQRVKEEILQKVVEKTKIDLPETLVTKELERVKKEVETYLKEGFKKDLESYLQEVKKSKEEFEKELKKQAEKRVKYYLILTKIAEVENLYPTEEEVEQEAQERLKEVSSVKEAEEKFKDPENLKAICREYLLQQKVLEFLESLAQNENKN